MLHSGLATEPRRAALAMLAARASRVEQEWAIGWLRTQPPEGVVQCLASNQIDQLFLHRAEAQGLVPHLPEGLVELLAARKLAVVATALVQERALDEACDLLEKIGLDYLVFKGALLRRVLYSDTHLRPCMDLDLLVTASGLDEAVRAFDRCGYRVAVPANTHELSLVRGGVCIDLHWHVMRPGRMRWDVTAELLHQRARQGGLWGPGENHATVLMLVHPAVTDHVTGRWVLAADLDLWLRSRSTRWEAVLRLLARIGLRTAAWTMLFWTHCLFDTPVPRDVWSELAPGAWRKQYLEGWLALNPAAMYATHPWLVRAAFSLALQDRIGDSVRAVSVLWQKQAELALARRFHG